MINKSYEKNHLRSILDSFKYEEFTQMHQEWLKTGQMIVFMTGNFTRL